MKKLVVFSGAGISAESGLKTFRDSDGLWENYNVMEVATPQAWQSNPALVLEFYNQRRKQALEAQPNEAHNSIVQLEQRYEVQVVTQNIDDLHERAGSTKVLHLHGEIRNSRSSSNPSLVYQIEGEKLQIGEKCETGSQLRPDIVWFGEPVPNMEKAHGIVSEAEILLIVGTSLNVYPAAGLIHFASQKCKKYLVDPKDVKITDVENLEFLQEKAGTGVPKVVAKLLSAIE